MSKAYQKLIGSFATDTITGKVIFLIPCKVLRRRELEITMQSNVLFQVRRNFCCKMVYATAVSSTRSYAPNQGTYKKCCTIGLNNYEKIKPYATLVTEHGVKKWDYIRLPIAVYTCNVWHKMSVIQIIPAATEMVYVFSIFVLLSISYFRCI